MAWTDVIKRTTDWTDVITGEGWGNQPWGTAWGGGVSTAWTTVSKQTTVWT